MKSPSISMVEQLMSAILNGMRTPLKQYTIVLGANKKISSLQNLEG